MGERQVIYIALWLFLILLIFRLVLDYVFQFARSWRPREGSCWSSSRSSTLSPIHRSRLLRRVIRRCVSGRWHRPVLLALRSDHASAAGYL